jgi:hypothetical protein
MREAVIGGLVAGTVDIGAACAINAVGPVIVTQAIASGLVGTASFKGGADSAFLGLLLQWAMCILIAFIYGFAVDLFPGLRARWVAAGLICGAVTFFVMNYGVMRLSALGRFPHFSPVGFMENFVAILLFGLIISFVARRRNPAGRR